MKKSKENGVQANEIFEDYSNIIADRDNFQNNQLVKNLGRLARRITGSSDSNTVKGEVLLEVISELPELECTIISLKFGINGQKTNSTEQIAKQLSKRKECVRLIEASTLRKLRKPNCLSKFYIPFQ